MVVKELMDILNQYPEDMRIVLDDQDTSVEDVGIIQKIPIMLDANSESWNGSHKECRWSKKHDEIALLICRAR